MDDIGFNVCIGKDNSKKIKKQINCRKKFDLCCRTWKCVNRGKVKSFNVIMTGLLMRIRLRLHSQRVRFVERVRRARSKNR